MAHTSFLSFVLLASSGLCLCIVYHFLTHVSVLSTILGDTGLSHVHAADGRGWIGYDPYRYCRMELRLPLDKPQRLQAMVSMHLMGYMPSCTRSESLLGRLLLLSGQEGFLHHTMFFLVVGTIIPPIWTLLPMQI